MRFSTKLIHGNYNLEKTGATNVPIYMSNAYAHSSPAELENIFKGKFPGYVYSRLSNPTVLAFERRMASIEGGLTATSAASGMSAIYMAITNIVSPGDEIIASTGLYGGTYTLISNLKDIGVKVIFLEEINEESLLNNITKSTKLVYAETIGNPKLDILDAETVGKVCNQKGIIFMVDSTISTPCLISPIEYGADIIIHSTSKYINGTSNAIGGTIVDCGSQKYKNYRYENFHEYAKKYGKLAFTAKLKSTIGVDIGAAMSPFNAFLSLTGVETLALRMKQHCKNAMKVAEYLEKSPKVTSVNYPNLKSSKYYELAEKYYKNGASGILTFRLGSKENAFKFLGKLKLILDLTNIGDCKTIIIHPASTICSSNTPEEREKMAVYDDLLRLSVGIEDVDDILEDIDRALEAI
ncbi:MULTISPECIES: O-acetylhomoserine aminocarboxypropyltransferase/cysteine synthase family protein [Clostridium]|uniref:O-acetylhomoserine aminocarboxypropyltransferase/cysteine synthase family protein n=1 Tax=Clostridium TaxID=1485 RepID=UPI0008265E9F|nr:MULTISPECIES: O-acetylhomoserine aminocarboxypropyltransferase/cysteine synthase family protein [Clostridium]PJI08277.1 O-acetylhomoserine aminocarboxypropyltransferase/cysteine synthase [Clostridium sp. CT7]